MTPQNDRPPISPPDPDIAAANTGPGAGLEAPAPDLTDDKVRGVLRGLGRLLHQFAGHNDFPEHWSFTPDELDELTPPITRYVNRSRVLQRAVEHGDLVALAIGLAGWAARNVDLGATIAEETAGLEAEPPEPGAPPAGPPHPVLGPLYTAELP